MKVAARQNRENKRTCFLIEHFNDLIVQTIRWQIADEESLEFEKQIGGELVDNVSPGMNTCKAN